MNLTIIVVGAVLSIYIGIFLLFGYMGLTYYKSVQISNDGLTDGTEEFEFDKQQIDDFIINLENCHPNLT